MVLTVVASLFSGLSLTASAAIATLGEGVTVIEDNALTNITPADVTALAPYRAYSQTFIRESNTVPYPDAVYANMYSWQASATQLTSISDGTIADAGWEMSFACSDTTSANEARLTFMDLVYDLGTTANITNILLGHRAGYLMTTQFDVYVTDSYNINAELPVEDRIASYNSTNKNTNRRNLFTLNRTGQYVIIRVYQCTPGTQGGIRIPEFNVFGTKKYDITITSKTESDNTAYFSGVDAGKVLAPTKKTGTSYRYDTTTSSYKKVQDWISNSDRLNDGVVDSNNADIGQKFLDGATQDNSTVSYKDGKMFYTILTYDLGLIKQVEDVLIVHANDTNLQTGHYEVYTSTNSDTLYNEENRVVNYSNTAKIMTKSQLIHFNVPVKAQFVGIKVLNPTQNLSTSSVSNTYNVRLREFQVYGKDVSVANLADDVLVTEDSVDVQLGPKGADAYDPVSIKGYGYRVKGTTFDIEGCRSKHPSTVNSAGLTTLRDNQSGGDFMFGESTMFNENFKWDPDYGNGNAVTSYKWDDRAFCADIVYELNEAKEISYIVLAHHASLTTTQFDVYVTDDYTTATAGELSADDLVASYGKDNKNTFKRNLFRFTTPRTGKYVVVRVWQPVPANSKPQVRLTEFNVFAAGAVITATYPEDVFVVEDGKTEEINPEDGTAITPVRVFAQRYSEVSTGKYGNATKAFEAQADSAAIATLTDGKIDTNVWEIGGDLGFEKYYTTTPRNYDSHKYFVDVVYDLGVPSQIKGIVLGHLADAKLTTQFDVYVTDEYSVKPDLDADDLVASYGKDNKNKTIRNLLTFDRTAQYVVVRIYQPSAGDTDAQIRLSELNVFGLKNYNTTVTTSKTVQTDVYATFNTLNAAKSLIKTAPVAETHTYGTAWTAAAATQTNAAKAYDGATDTTLNNISGLFLDNQDSAAATKSYIDGKNFYVTYYYDLGGVMKIEDVLLVHDTGDNTTGYYELYAANTAADLYKPENRIVNYSNYDDAKSQGQLFHFNLPVDAQFVGIKVLNPTQNKDESSKSADYFVRNQEFNVYGTDPNATAFADLTPITGLEQGEAGAYKETYVDGQGSLLFGKTPVAVKVFQNSQISAGSVNTPQNITNADCSGEGQLGTGVLWITKDYTTLIDNELEQYVDTVWALDGVADINDLELYFHQSLACQISHFKIALLDSSFDVNAEDYNSVFNDPTKHMEISESSAGWKFDIKDGKGKDVKYLAIRVICGVSGKIAAIHGTHYARLHHMVMHGTYKNTVDSVPLTLETNVENGAKPYMSGATDMNGKYTPGSQVTVFASNIDGYMFTGWHDGTKIVSSNNPYTIAMPEQQMTLTAQYKAVKVTYYEKSITYGKDQYPQDVAAFGENLIGGKFPDIIQIDGVETTISGFSAKTNKLTDGLFNAHNDLAGYRGRNDGTFDLIYFLDKDPNAIKEINMFLQSAISGDSGGTQYITGKYEVYAAIDYNTLFSEENMIYDYDYKRDGSHRLQTAQFTQGPIYARYVAFRLIDPCTTNTNMSAYYTRISEIAFLGKNADIKLEETEISTNMPLDVFTTDSKGKSTSLNDDVSLTDLEKMTDGNTATAVKFKTDDNQLNMVINLCQDFDLTGVKLDTASDNTYKVYVADDYAGLFNESAKVSDGEWKPNENVKGRYVRIAVDANQGDITVEEFSVKGLAHPLIDRYGHLSYSMNASQISVFSKPLDSTNADDIAYVIGGSYDSIFDISTAAESIVKGAEVGKSSLNMLIDFKNLNIINDVTIYFPASLTRYQPKKTNIYLAETLDDAYNMAAEPDYTFNDMPSDYGIYSASFKPTLARYMRIEFVEANTTEDIFNNDELHIAVSEIDIQGVSVVGMADDSGALATFTDAATNIEWKIQAIDSNDILPNIYSSKLVKSKATNKQMVSLYNDPFYKVLNNDVYKIEFYDFSGNLVTNLQNRTITITVPTAESEILTTLIGDATDSTKFEFLNTSPLTATTISTDVAYTADFKFATLKLTDADDEYWSQVNFNEEEEEEDKEDNTTDSSTDTDSDTNTSTPVDTNTNTDTNTNNVTNTYKPSDSNTNTDTDADKDDDAVVDDSDPELVEVDAGTETKYKVSYSEAPLWLIVLTIVQGVLFLGAIAAIIYMVLKKKRTNI